MSFVTSEITFSNALLSSTSAEYDVAVSVIKSYFASTQGFLLESISFSTIDLVSTQVTLVMSVTSTTTVDINVVISEVIIDKILQIRKLYNLGHCHFDSYICYFRHFSNTIHCSRSQDGLYRFCRPKGRFDCCMVC